MQCFTIQKIMIIIVHNQHFQRKSFIRLYLESNNQYKKLYWLKLVKKLMETWIFWLNFAETTILKIAFGMNRVKYFTALTLVSSCRPKYGHRWIAAGQAFCRDSIVAFIIGFEFLSSSISLHQSTLTSLKSWRNFWPCLK